jgi:DNA repair exonuclease SbcCD ATPase subunit
VREGQAVSEIQSRIQYYTGVISQLNTQADGLRTKIESEEQEITDLEEARRVLFVVTQIAQLAAKDKVESLVTAAIRAVYDRDFKFKLLFKKYRGKSVAKAVVEEEGNEYNARDDLGGGMVDIISFALRLVMWSMRPDRTRSTIVLDEPLKFIGQGELMERAAAFVKTISSRLGIQFIILTHDHQLAEIADRAWAVTHRNGRSKVKRIQ